MGSTGCPYPHSQLSRGMSSSHGRNARPLGNVGPSDPGTFQLCVSGRDPGTGAKATRGPPTRHWAQGVGTRKAHPGGPVQLPGLTQQAARLACPASPLSSRPDPLVSPSVLKSEPSVATHSLSSPGSLQPWGSGPWNPHGGGTKGHTRRPGHLTLSRPAALTLSCPGGPQQHQGFGSC